MSRIFIDCPPKGAKVRHTTTYIDGPTITVEGHAFDISTAVGRDEPYILIGDEAHHWCSYLVDRPGAYTVAMEVLEAPLPPQPPVGSVVEAVLANASSAQRLHRRGTHWWTSLLTGLDYKWEEVCVQGVPVLLVADPAVGAPGLPWTAPHYDEEGSSFVVERNPHSGDSLLINGKGLSATRIRELMGICARHLKPGAERDALLQAAQANTP